MVVFNTIKGQRWVAIAFALIFLCTNVTRADTIEASRGLISRTLPKYADRFAVETIDRDPAGDVFEIESRGDQIILRGNDGVSIASALNYYIEDIANGQISWSGPNHLDLPSLPPVPAKIRRVTRFRTRFAYNFCTHGYTYAWWDWPQWEREIDFLALKGFNTALVIQGEEAVWMGTLQNFGYTPEQIRAWLVMPSHQPWMLMSNCEGLGGPVPQSVIDRRLVLGQKMIGRMRELGIEPTTVGYYGMVPSDFKSRFPQANVHAQGKWGGLKRPDLLDYQDPMFAQVADAFYAETKKCFGTINDFAADPFHEGGTTKGIDIPKAGHSIFDAMTRSNPLSTWVLQSWTTNPHKAMLDELPKDRLLVIDLYCEVRPQWKVRDAFDGVPWVWSIIHNFGGNTGLAGSAATISSDIDAAWQSPKKGQMVGIGVTPEGSDTIPFIWELLDSQVWSDGPVDLQAYLPIYLRDRYGFDDANAVSAWRTLLKTVYATNGKAGGDYPINSVLMGRPSRDPAMRARAFVLTTPGYETADLLPAWEGLLAAAKAHPDVATLRFDLADVTRQVLAELGRKYHIQSINALDAGDSTGVRAMAEKQLRLLDDLDAVVGTQPNWLLGTWISQARDWGTTPEEKDLAEFNARVLLGQWSEPAAYVDYANRQWAGLIKGYYRERWKMWFDSMTVAAVNGHSFDDAAAHKSIAAFEASWNHSHDMPATQPSGDILAIAQQMYDRYQQDVRAGVPRKTYVMDAGSWKPLPKGLREFRATLEWAGVPQITDAGTYRVTFKFTGGKNALSFTSVQLLAGDEVIAQDSHDGWAGSDPPMAEYVLTLKSKPANPLHLRALVRYEGGPDSAGTVTIEPIKS